MTVQTTTCLCASLGTCDVSGVGTSELVVGGGAVGGSVTEPAGLQTDGGGAGTPVDSKERVSLGSVPQVQGSTAGRGKEVRY